MISHIDLFSGIGGFSLAASKVWNDYQTIVFCEKDNYCKSILSKRFPNVPNIDDIREFNGHLFYGATILSAGFPCQPFSTASHGRIVAEDMSSCAIKAVVEARPLYVVFENVQESIIRYCSEQIKDIGYDSSCYRANAVGFGMPHRRNRWWLVAHSYNKGQFSSYIDAKTQELSKLEKFTRTAEDNARAFRVYNGIPYRMDRLKCLGNAIVPQIAEFWFESIKEYMNLQ